MTEPSATGAWGDDPLWYKDANIYQMHVKAFFDGNGDGMGDFAGLAAKVDYVQELGVNTIWLLPFYPSPMRDDGYDISDYRNVHPAYGTLKEFRTFIREAHRRGLKVITELVINHTSDQHAWFQAARTAPPGSAAREMYVWSDTDKKFAGTRIIFTDTEVSNWAWDPVARAYYWHRFFSHQPDLNHNNPRVVRAVTSVMRFWLDMGVDGLRLDAIPYLCVREGTSNENLPETHQVLRHMRAVVDANYRGRMFLAEANQWPEDVCEYFGNGDECHMAYHFPLMPRMFMALALEDRYPITEIMRQTPEIPESCQWAIFVRNHDELTLEMVTNRERDYMYRMYAQESRMRVNVGIRRRLAPLLDNDVDRIKLVNCLLLSMPGSPIIYYGDEIGMGDNIFLGDRNGVRTPMQWSLDRNAGFSRADPQKLYLPLVMDPIYGYQAVNVEAQSRDPSSLLNWTKRILAVRRQHKCFSRGTLEFLRPKNRKVLAYVRSYQGDTILCVANLSRTAQAVELELAPFRGRVPVELMGHNAFPPIGELPYFLTLPSHGFFWLLLSETEPPPAWHIERLPATELAVLVLMDGLDSLVAGGEQSERGIARRTRQQFEREVLPEFVQHRRWFAGKGSGIARVEVGRRAMWRTSRGEWLITLLDVELAGGVRQRYFLPLTRQMEDAPDTGGLRTAEWTLAKIRQRASAGLLLDAFAEPGFCIDLVEAMREGSRVPFGDGELRCEMTPGCRAMLEPPLEPVEHPGREQSNTGVVVRDRLFLKGYRLARAGVNPEIEMGRFLTEAGFKAIAPLAGSIEHVSAGGERTALVSVFGFVRNQGDGWNYALDHLDRHAASLAPQGGSGKESPHALFLSQMLTLGRRVGELHTTFARASAAPDFEPEPITATDLAQWQRAVSRDVDASLRALKQRMATLDAPIRTQAKTLLGARARLRERIAQVGARPVVAVKTRYHGDLHLGQVLLTADDFIIIDFEGEPGRPLEERRRKHSPLRDIAGMLRSFDYARAVALDKAVAARPDRREQVSGAFESWLHSCSRAFLDGYRTGVGAAPCWPAAEGDAAALIGLFQIEKATYELRYELDNRPAWVGVPISGLLALARGR